MRDFPVNTIINVIMWALILYLVYLLYQKVFKGSWLEKLIFGDKELKEAKEIGISRPPPWQLSSKWQPIIPTDEQARIAVINKQNRWIKRQLDTGVIWFTNPGNPLEVWAYLPATGMLTAMSYDAVRRGKPTPDSTGVVPNMMISDPKTYSSN